MVSSRPVFFPPLSEARAHAPSPPRKVNGPDATGQPQAAPRRRERPKKRKAQQKLRVPGVVVFGQLNLLHKQLDRDLKGLSCGMGDRNEGIGHYPETLRRMLARVRVIDDYLVGLIEETEAV